MKTPTIIACAIFTTLTVSGHAEITPRTLETTSLASFLDIYAKSFDLSAPGTQSSFGYRLTVYLDGKPIGQTIWYSDGRESGRLKNQRFTVILKNVKAGIEFWVEHNASASRGTIKLKTKMRPAYFPAVPVANSDRSFTLGVLGKNSVLRDRSDSDFTPSSGNLVVVLETKEEREPTGVGQPATKPADMATVKDQPSTPTPMDSPR